MDSTPALSLPVGTPIIAVGFTFADPISHHHVHAYKMPEIVLTGRLMEPFNDTGRALLLSPGPLARNIGGHGFRSVTAGLAGEQIVSFRKRSCDEHGAFLYLAMSDKTIVEAIEDAQRNGELVWPNHLMRASAIALRIMATFRRLDVCARGSLTLAA